MKTKIRGIFVDKRESDQQQFFNLCGPDCDPVDATIEDILSLLDKENLWEYEDEEEEDQPWNKTLSPYYEFIPENEIKYWLDAARDDYNANLL
jgi:hypothetical protein